MGPCSSDARLLLLFYQTRPRKERHLPRRHAAFLTGKHQQNTECPAFLRVNAPVLPEVRPQRSENAEDSPGSSHHDLGRQENSRHDGTEKSRNDIDQGNLYAAGNQAATDESEGNQGLTLCLGECLAGEKCVEISTPEQLAGLAGSIAQARRTVRGVQILLTAGQETMY